MDENRYAPPRAAVEDARVATPEGCPVQVTNAIKLWAASYCMGLLVLIGYWEHFSGLQPRGSLVFNQLFSLALSAWLYYKIYLGRNWARISWLVLAILGGVMMLSGTVRNIALQMPMLARVNMLTSVGINVVILWLLFFSPGRKWFQHRAV